MKVIKYHVTLREPALVTSVQGDPNSAVAFDYLPGSVLRGILIGKYLGSHSADASDDVLREIFDFAVEAQDDKQQWQPVPAPFYTQSGEDVRLIRPARNVAVHTQRTARFGRAMPEYRPTDSRQASRGLTKLLDTDEIAGAVYRYDALAAGQTFQAAIICDNDDDKPILEDLIGGYVTLGGSRSGGYGRAEIKLMTDDDSDWDATEDAEDAPEGKLIVTLQSDVLLRDERGQFAVDPELLRQMLGRHLRVELELEDAFLGAEEIGGFNRKWGLPLPQALAVRMGSVLVFKDPGCDRRLLDDLEVRGIGEHRTEGFGRIVFDRQRMTKMNATENKNMGKSRGPDNFTISQTEARNLAELMVNRMLSRRLDERLLAAANTVKIANPPSNAQISRLQFIKSIEARGSARHQFERSTINEKPLLNWLKRLLRDGSQDAWTMDDNEWKALLGLSGVEVGARIGDVKANIDDALRLEYVLRLIDLVLARTAKQRGKEN